MTGSALFSYAPLMLAAYLAVALLAPTLCTHLGRSALALLAVLPAITTAWAAAMLPAVMDGGALTSHTEWVPAIDLAIDLRMDALAMALTLIIAFIGALVLVYSARYFPPDDDGLTKYSGSLVAFAGAMLGLVWADNLILLVIFWELTGIMSYLLIAHRAGKKSSRTAASQALLVTTAGGLVMLVGAVMLGVLAGTFTISEILAEPPSGPLITTSVVLLITRINR
jgi:multicomponent Na+:H+ antiporter subunit A